MKKTLAILLAVFIVLLTSAVPVYADDDEGNEAKENEAGEDSGSDEKENSVPGFEVAFAAAGLLGAARLLRSGIL